MRSILYGIAEIGGFAWRFVRGHVVLSIATAAALVTVAFVPPDDVYLTYCDYDTLICLFCILAVVGSLRALGVFERLARMATERMSGRWRLALALVLATGALSMVATNDMALIMMLPLSVAALARVGAARLIPATFVLQSLAANLCGMIVPFGNPQNLYLYSYYDLGLGQFLTTMALPFACSTVLVALCTWVIAGRSEKDQAGEAKNSGSQPKKAAGGGHPPSKAAQDTPDEAAAKARRWKWVRAILCAGLLVLTVGSVLRLVPPLVALVSVIVVLAATDVEAFRRVDYGLLCTFVAFFVFSGNMARIPEISLLLRGVMDTFPLIAAAGFSQVISNVPAAVLLSHFTEAWQPVLVGVNIGGAGTLVGSLASLITLQHMRLARSVVKAADKPLVTTGAFMKVFTVLNLAFLAVLLVVCVAAFGW